MKVKFEFTLDEECDGLDYHSKLNLEHDKISKAKIIFGTSFKIEFDGTSAQAFKLKNDKWEAIWENLPELRDAIIKLGKSVERVKSSSKTIEFWNGYNSALHDMLKLLNGTLSI